MLKTVQGYSCQKIRVPRDIKLESTVSVSVFLLEIRQKMSNEGLGFENISPWVKQAREPRLGSSFCCDTCTHFVLTNGHPVTDLVLFCVPTVCTLILL